MLYNEHAGPHVCSCDDVDVRRGKPLSPPTEPEDDIDPRLKSCDPELIAKIEMEIVDNGDPITFDDIGTIVHRVCELWFVSITYTVV